MGESDAAGSARLERRLWTLRVAILPWLVLVVGPMSLGMKDLVEPLPLAFLYANMATAVPLHLATLFLRRQPGLAAVVLSGALLFALTLSSGRDAMSWIHHTGWHPVIWAGLLALSQLTIVLLAWRAWRLAPPGGHARYWVAFAAAMAPFVIRSALDAQLEHPGSESTTLGDIRTIISAEVAYSSANLGFYDVPECLGTPQRCIPGYPVAARPFLDSQLGQTSAVKSGYRRVFHPGPGADPSGVRRVGASASSLVSYAYVAVPLVPGQAGLRAFCGDATGRICYTPDGRAPGIENGQCAASCETLR